MPQVAKAKVCRLCGVDCTALARVRDQFGRYYCKPCYTREEQRGRAAPSHSADPSSTGTNMGLTTDAPAVAGLAGPTSVSSLAARLRQQRESGGSSPAVHGPHADDPDPVSTPAPFRDSRGREVVIADAGDGVIPLAEPTPPPIAGRWVVPETLCVDCGMPIAADARVCKHCGFDRQSGKSVGERSVLRPTVPETCRKCGYDMRGLSDTRCPECGTDHRVGGGRPVVCKGCGADISKSLDARCGACGTVNIRRARHDPRVDARRSAARAYAVAAAILGVSILIGTVVAALPGGASIGAFALVALASQVLCVGAFMLMTVAWLGEGDPLSLDALRMAAMVGAADALQAGTLGTLATGFGGVMGAVLVLAIISYLLFGIDWEDRWIVLGIMSAVKAVATVGGLLGAAWLGW